MRRGDTVDEVYEEEIDLRQYISAMLAQWYLIIGLGLMASLGMLGASYLNARQETYEAAAVVRLTKPALQSTADFASAAKLVPTLAASDATLERVIARLLSEGAVLPPGLQSASGLRSVSTTTSSADGTLLVLRVRAGDPGQAAATANAWAGVVVSLAPDISPGGQKDLAVLEGRLVDAETELARAEASLAELEANANLVGLQAELSAQQQARQSYQSERYAATRLMDDIESFRARIAAFPPETRVPAADELVATLLEVRTFSTGSGLPGAMVSPYSSSAGAPDAAAGRKAAEVSALLDKLTEILRARLKSLDASITQNASRSAETQSKISLEQGKKDRLVTNRDATKEVFNGLTKRVNEARIYASNSTTLLEVSSQASPPPSIGGPDRWRSVAIAGGLGLLVGAVVVLAMEWWRQGKQPEAAG